MLAPVAPYISEEIWSLMGKPYSIHTQAWPAVDEEAAAEDEITLVVQVNGKLRGHIRVPKTATKDAIEKMALADEGVARHTEGKPIKKIIVVPGKLLNVVV